MHMRIAPLAISDLEKARALLERACKFDQASDVAREKIFGPSLEAIARPIGAYYGAQLVGVASVSNKWIRLLAVDPSYRLKGIGSKLLGACETQIATEHRVIEIMAQPGNYLSPGIDQRNQETLEWLTKRSYVDIGDSCNLLIKLQDNPKVSLARLSELKVGVEEAGYRVLRMSSEQMQATMLAVEEHFSSGWAYEVSRACQGASPTVYIAVKVDSGSLAAFAVHDGNNRGLGWFGPTGTFTEHRSKGLGAALLMACLCEIRQQHSHAEVAWIGPRQFYDKIAGVESERHFTRMKKELND